MLHWPHHDWLHVLGNYDVTVIGEVENAAFGAASCNKTGASKTEKADLTLGFPGLSPRQLRQTTGERERSACERNPN